MTRKSLFFDPYRPGSYFSKCKLLRFSGYMPLLCATLKMQVLRRGLNDGSEAIKELTPSNPWLIFSGQGGHFGLQFALLIMHRDCSKIFSWSSQFPYRVLPGQCQRVEISVNTLFLKLKQVFCSVRET